MSDSSNLTIVPILLCLSLGFLFFIAPKSLNERAGILGQFTDQQVKQKPKKKKKKKTETNINIDSGSRIAIKSEDNSPTKFKSGSNTMDHSLMKLQSKRSTDDKLKKINKKKESVIVFHSENDLLPESEMSPVVDESLTKSSDDDESRRNTSPVLTNLLKYRVKNDLSSFSAPTKYSHLEQLDSKSDDENNQFKPVAKVVNIISEKKEINYKPLLKTKPNPSSKEQLTKKQRENQRKAEKIKEAKKLENEVLFNLLNY